MTVPVVMAVVVVVAVAAVVMAAASVVAAIAMAGLMISASVISTAVGAAMGTIVAMTLRLVCLGLPRSRLSASIAPIVLISLCGHGSAQKGQASDDGAERVAQDVDSRVHGSFSVLRCESATGLSCLTCLAGKETPVTGAHSPGIAEYECAADKRRRTEAG
jgi:hypothetical protein